MRPHLPTLLTITLTFSRTARADYALDCDDWYQRVKCYVDGAVCQGSTLVTNVPACQEKCHCVANGNAADQGTVTMTVGGW